MRKIMYLATAALILGVVLSGCMSSDQPIQERPGTVGMKTEPINPIGTIDLPLPHMTPVNVIPLFQVDGKVVKDAEDYFITITVTNNDKKPVVLNKIESNFSLAPHIFSNEKSFGVLRSNDDGGWSIAAGKSMSFNFSSRGRLADIISAQSGNKEYALYLIFENNETLVGECWTILPPLKDLQELNGTISGGYPLTFVYEDLKLVISD